MTSSIQFPNEVNWDDYDDNAFDEECSEDEVTNMLKRAGLPHAKRESYELEGKKEACPEIKEARDELVEEGHSLGRHKRGRGGYPERLRSKDQKKR